MLHNFELCSDLVPFHTLAHSHTHTHTRRQRQSQMQADPEILLRQLNSVENIQGNNKNNSSLGRVASAECRVPFWRKGKWRATHTNILIRIRIRTQIHACKSFCWRQMLPSLLFILTFLFYFHGAFCKHLWPSPRVPSPPSRYSQLCCQLFILFYFSFSSLNTHTHIHVRNERKDIFLHIFLTFKNNLPAAFPPCHLFEPP